MALTFANKITIVRILAVPFFIATLLYYAPVREYLRYVALGIFLFAVISDVIDGYVARTRNQKTQAGIILDPLADKLLLISAFICLHKVGQAYFMIRFPMWLVVAVISRDVILLLGATIIHIVKGRFYLEASRWGKITTFFQVMCVIGVILQWEYVFFFFYITVLFVVISGVGYIRNGIKVLNEPSNQNVT